MATADREAWATEAAAVAGWDVETSLPALEILKGGATYMTFRLESQNGTHDPVCARRLREKDTQLVAVTVALSDSGTTPPVVAFNDDWVIQEFMDGTAGTAASLAEASGLAAAGQLIGRFHASDLCDTVEGVDHDTDQMGSWFARAATVCAETEGMEATLALLQAEAERDTAEATAEGAAAHTVLLSHGDLHLGNMLFAEDGSTCLVDLEYVAKRAAGSDLAYWFAVWGDLRMGAGMTPAYPPLADRMVFARAYLAGRLGQPAEDIDDAAVRGLLLEIETHFAVAQRARLIMIWLLLSHGDASHALLGYAKMLAPALGVAWGIAADPANHEAILEQGTMPFTLSSLS